METKISIQTIESAVILQSCAVILKNAYNGVPWFDSWTDETALACLMCSYKSPDFKGWTITANSILIGGCSGNIEPYYTGNYYYLKQMFIAPQYQQAGVGAQLLKAVIGQLELSGITTVMLFTRESISGFYERAAFKKVEDMSMMMFDTNENSY